MYNLQNAKPVRRFESYFILLAGAPGNMKLTSPIITVVQTIEHTRTLYNRTSQETAFLLV